ncbi:MAG: hypothetical protein A2V86_05470 [Deltaproteobacteria bacterium RBG_16_49_23]|nr:MAG: hypothetical protein A2V86_05470 [Deltaproteobacteria bacterium RBG_16_49_23]
MKPRILEPLDFRNIAYHAIFFKSKFNKKVTPQLKRQKRVGRFFRRTFRPYRVKYHPKTEKV